MYPYIYTHIYIYTHRYLFRVSYVYTYIYIYTYLYIYIYIFMDVSIYLSNLYLSNLYLYIYLALSLSIYVRRRPCGRPPSRVVGPVPSRRSVALQRRVAWRPGFESVHNWTWKDTSSRYAECLAFGLLGFVVTGGRYGGNFSYLYGDLLNCFMEFKMI